MTTTINQNQDGDITLEIVDGLESVRQRVTQRLRMFRGEYYLDTRQGVPYIDDILKHNYDEALANRVITDTILSVQDVTGVTDISLSFVSATRELTYNANVQTIFGNMSISQ